MHFKSIALASAAIALILPATAEARSMRAVGSSTVYPFAKMAAERVARANPRLGTPIIESTGTGAGFKLFCAGVGERFPDISNASRRMKAKEAAQCAATGVKDVTEIQIGLDGVVVATRARPPSRASPSATFIWRSPRPRSASPTRRRRGRTSTPGSRRFRSASTARRRPAARATRSANC
jgi:ABC-type phosphate transport system substrate-binding protein